MIIPRTTTSKHYPKFIRENKTLKKFAKQKKVFQKIGLPNCESSIGKNRKIVFSADGNKGLWDIATMSMRGVASCQRWGSYHAKALIGSMIDPYCGIIYITNGNKHKHGEKMLYRALVRFVVDRENNPALMMERIYPRIIVPQLNPFYDHPSVLASYRRKLKSRDQVLNLFKSFLKEKTDNKLSIITSPNSHNIPMSNPVSNINANLISYRDSGIRYKRIPKFSSVSKIHL